MWELCEEGGVEGARTLHSLPGVPPRTAPHPWKPRSSERSWLSSSPVATSCSFFSFFGFFPPFLFYFGERSNALACTHSPPNPPGFVFDRPRVARVCSGRELVFTLASTCEAWTPRVTGLSARSCVCALGLGKWRGKERRLNFFAQKQTCRPITTYFRPGQARGEGQWEKRGRKRSRAVAD